MSKVIPLFKKKYFEGVNKLQTLHLFQKYLKVIYYKQLYGYLESNKLLRGKNLDLGLNFQIA